MTTKNPTVRRNDLACEALSGARTTNDVRARALEALDALLTETGRGPWPLDHSPLWRWDDGQDVWIVEEDDLRAAVESAADWVTSVGPAVIEGLEDDGLVTATLYELICDATSPLYSRIGSGLLNDAGLVEQARAEHGDAAAEEIADLIGYDPEGE